MMSAQRRADKQKYETNDDKSTRQIMGYKLSHTYMMTKAWDKVWHMLLQRSMRHIFSHTFVHNNEQTNKSMRQKYEKNYDALVKSMRKINEQTNKSMRKIMTHWTKVWEKLTSRPTKVWENYDAWDKSMRKIMTHASFGDEQRRWAEQEKYENCCVQEAYFILLCRQIMTHRLLKDLLNILYIMCMYARMCTYR